MKNSIIIVLLLAGSNLFGQTDSLEKSVLYNKLISKAITQAEYSKISSLWSQRIAKYPDQPLDQNGQVHYSFINQFKGLDKEKLFNRTCEWLAINYGLNPAEMYTNLKDGKIIFRNSLQLIKNYSVVPTTIISIKDEKIRIELISIMYQVYSEGDYASGIPEKTINININEVYPIILKKPDAWESNAVILGETKKFFSNEAKNLWDYILNYDNSNNF